MTTGLREEWEMRRKEGRKSMMMWGITINYTLCCKVTITGARNVKYVGRFEAIRYKGNGKRNTENVKNAEKKRG